jgi:hypothetical protein
MSCENILSVTSGRIDFFSLWRLGYFKHYNEYSKNLSLQQSFSRISKDVVCRDFCLVKIFLSYIVYIQSGGSRIIL